MKHHLYPQTLLLLLMTCCLWGCSDEEAPVSESPIVLIGSSNVTGRTTATVNGSISFSAGTEIAECGFIYSTLSSFPDDGSTVAPLPAPTSSTFYEIELTGLEPGTQYYYCIYASNGYNSVRSESATFTTDSAGTPALATVTNTATTESSISIQSSVTDNGGYDLIYIGFCYKQVEIGDATLPDAEGNGSVVSIAVSESEQFSTTLTGLTPGAAYVIRAYATNALGIGYSTAITVVTGTDNVPTVSAVTISGLTSTSVHAEATLQDPGSGEVTEVGFCWSTESSLPTIQNNSYAEASLQMSDNSFSLDIPDLSPNTTYYIRAYAVNSFGPGYGEVYRFTTESNTSDLSVSTEYAGNITTTTAVLTATIYNATDDITEKGFLLGTNRESLLTGGGTAYTVQTEDTYFSYEVTGLTPSTTYYYCAYVVSGEEGTYTYGDVRSFSTNEESYNVWVEWPDIDNVTSSTADVQSTFGGDGADSVTEKGFCYTDGRREPVIDDYKVVSDADGNEISATLTELQADTKYWIRAYVIVNGTVVYSGSIDFTTSISEIPGEDDLNSPDIEIEEQ